MVLSLEPEQSKLLLEAKDPTLPECPSNVLTHFKSWVSHIYTSPENVPTVIMLLFYDQWTEVIWSVKPRSQSFVTLLVFAYHKYTHELNPTASIFDGDQSNKFR